MDFLSFLKEPFSCWFSQFNHIYLLQAQSNQRNKVFLYSVTLRKRYIEHEWPTLFSSAPTLVIPGHKSHNFKQKHEITRLNSHCQKKPYSSSLEKVNLLGQWWNDYWSRLLGSATPLSPLRIKIHSWRPGAHWARSRLCLPAVPALLGEGLCLHSTLEWGSFTRHAAPKFTVISK